MSDREPKARTPDLLVEKLAAGELDSEEARLVRARLEAEEGGLARLAAITRSNDEVLQEYPAARMARDIEERARTTTLREPEQRRRSPLWIGAPLAAAAAALLLFVVVPTTPGTSVVDGVDGVRSKGLAPRLQVFLADDGGSRALVAGEEARAGDLLQLGYVAAGYAFGAIISLDGRGEVTLHLPESGEQAARLESRGLVKLPTAYELDDAPGFERFFFVTSSSSFPLAVVTEAARSLGRSNSARRSPLSLPEGLSQMSVVVEKDASGRGR